MSLLDDFVDSLIRYGLEYFKRYYGPYRARVINNKDPYGLGRIIVEVPRARFPALNSEWVLPMMHGAGNQHGAFWPPEEDDFVFVFFDNGDPLIPLGYLGGWYAKEEVHPELAPQQDGTINKRGIRTPGGHLVVLSDENGKEKILIRHTNGTVVEWTADNKVKIGKEGGSFEPMMKGSTVQKWLENHTHAHSFGPTAPPIQPFPADGLSTDVEGS